MIDLPASIGLVQVLFVAAALLAAGLFATGYRPQLASRLVAIPIALAGAGLAAVGVSRFRSLGDDLFSGQELALLLALAALALVALGLGLAGREVRR